MVDQDDMEGESLTKPGKSGFSTVVYHDPIAEKLLEY